MLVGKGEVLPDSISAEESGHKEVIEYCMSLVTILLQINPIDPGDLPSNMRYFPRISPNSLKISLKFRATIHIQSLTNAHIFIKT